MLRAAALRPRRTLLIAAASASALLLAGCGESETGSSSGDTQFVGGTGQVNTVPASKRKAAPDISGESVDGKKLSLKDYRGKIVVLNVWGSWCAPCRAEAPHMAKVAKDTKPKGVEFIGINTRDLDKANARAFERTYDIDYPSFFDPSGKQVRRFPSNTLSPQTIPSTVVLDRDGKIAVRALKELSEDELRAMVKPLIAEK
ncbi:TlpA family protein disulfide reductase [Streptomyces sp. N2-109]|uniref:TlpA family protein disulfide reductase n=1 Tax=Streptomyces gossypii TaxID=2883101 RepID=A0ABT2JW02_9ACTN|nr:TlpA disulfide reductase family protein [Streptomyces gossypii]MCT2592092.1 TlpA family protein disulfide reductase [Streptomyces gossypii]